MTRKKSKLHMVYKAYSTKLHQKLRRKPESIAELKPYQT